MWLRTLFSSLIAVILHHVFLKHWSLSTKSEHQGSVTGTLASDLKVPAFYLRQETGSSDTLLISSAPSHRFRKCMKNTNHSNILPELSFTALFLLVRNYLNLIRSLNLIRKIKRKQLRRETCLHYIWEAINYKFSLWFSSFCLSPLEHSPVIFQIQNLASFFTIFHGFVRDCLELWITYIISLGYKWLSELGTTPLRLSQKHSSLFILPGQNVSFYFKSLQTELLNYRRLIYSVYKPMRGDFSDAKFGRRAF